MGCADRAAARSTAAAGLPCSIRYSVLDSFCVLPALLPETLSVIRCKVSCRIGSMDLAFYGPSVQQGVFPDELVRKISDCLRIELSKKSYGEGVARMTFHATCHGEAGVHSATGTVLHKKFTKSQRYLDVEFKLNPDDVKSCEPNSEELVEVIKKGVVATCPVVKEMGIKDFDFDSFYRDIADIIAERGFFKDPERYRFLPYERQPDIYKGPSSISTDKHPGHMDFRLYVHFNFNDEVKPGVRDQLIRISDHLAAELSKNEYGPRVTMVAMLVWCERLFNLRRSGGDWDQYSPSRKALLWNIKLDYGEVMSSDKVAFVEMVERDLLAACDEIKELNPREFDVDGLRRDLKHAFDSRDFAVSPPSQQDPAGQLMHFEMHPLVEDSDVKRGFVDHLNVLSEYLAKELSAKAYGPGLSRITMAVWCNIPWTNWGSFDSYFSNWKRYFEPRRALLCDVKLDYAKLKASNAKRFVAIVRRGILDTRTGVEALGIKNFDAAAFYRDLEMLLTDKDRVASLEEKLAAAQAKASEKVPEDEGSGIPEQLMMPEDDFWALIQESIQAGDGSVDSQIAFLEERLSTKTEGEIVGFELRFRDLVRRSYHYNVVALLKAIEGMVTDDPLLYFRCRLILYGRDVFCAVIDNPNKLKQKLDADWAEGLMYVADRAFIRKFGEETDKELPRDIGSRYSDYDAGDYPILGKEWDEDSFERRYARLLKLYG